SLAGTLYVLGSIAAAFYVIPQLWEASIARLFAARHESIVDKSLLGLVIVLLVAGLIFLGQRLVGSNPARGLRGGIFFGVVGVILLGLVTRAIGYILESAGIAGTTGQAVTMVIGLVLVAALASLYFRAGFAVWLVRI